MIDLENVENSLVKKLEKIAETEEGKNISRILRKKNATRIIKDLPYIGKYNSHNIEFIVKSLIESGDIKVVIKNLLFGFDDDYRKKIFDRLLFYEVAGKEPYQILMSYVFMSYFKDKRGAEGLIRVVNAFDQLYPHIGVIKYKKGYKLRVFMCGLGDLAINTRGDFFVECNNYAKNYLEGKINDYNSIKRLKLNKKD